MLIDQAKIYVKAGDGGKGCRSFYSDKYTRKKIPDGGDGGRGSYIIIRADRNLYTLLDFKYKREFRGQNGGHGSGNNKKGRDAPDVIIKVPQGTIVKDIKTGCLLYDLEKDLQEVTVVYGGKGGLGNQHRLEAASGEPGEERELFLDLKLLAEVGIVGFPNAGKSTLISNISNAHPEIAAYPFTTKAPVLGVVRIGAKSFVVADIPGLIEGSSCGKGLGDRFLRHIERTKILIHLVDMSGSEGRDPLEDYKAVNLELKNYSLQVSKKPQLIVANKMDLAQASENIERFRRALKQKVYSVSALKKEGLSGLIEDIAKRL